MSKNKLFLLDAYALIYRAYYAFIRNPRINSKGQNTSAIFGFINTLEEILKKENPSHIAVAFDPPGLTFRHEEFEAYKAQREATPEDIKMSVPIIKEVIRAYNIPIIEVEGYEADDVIGTIAKMVDKNIYDVYMMTPDKDYGQLTEPNVYIYKPKFGSSGFETLNDKAIMEKYNLTSPEQMIDLLGLMGDSSDNIPGCPGVGEKTAEKLLLEFGSIENLLQNTDKLKGALKKRVEENKEQIILSKYLATIKTDVPVELDEKSLARKDKNAEAITQLFEELEFRALLKRVLNVEEVPTKKTPKSDPAQGSLFDMFDESDTSDDDMPKEETDLSKIKHSYHFIESESEMTDLCNKLCKEKYVAMDTETTGVDAITAEMVGMSFSFKENEAYYVSVSANKDEATKQVAIFKPFFEDESIQKIGQNIKYDILVLKNYDIEVKGKLFDTMVAHYLINPELRHSMDYMAQNYLNYKTISIENLIGPKGKNQKTMRDIDPKIVSEYACEDADITLKLRNILAKELKTNNLEKLFNDIEAPLIYVLADMEWSGVRLDLDKLADLSKELNIELINIEKEIIDMAGIDFNVNSPKQIGEVLFDKLKISAKAKKTKTGQYSTNEEELQKLKDTHPIIDKILDQRGLKKLLSTYIDAFPQMVNNKTGKVHTSFNQTVAATGRLSSTNPNLQNIPIRDARGKAMRRVFIADEGSKFVSSDYSQIELRIMAHLSKDVNMIEAFNNNQDIHAATASKIFKVPIEEVTPEMRNKAKTANFGIIYGITAFGLSERLNIPRGEARDLIDEYFTMFPDVKKYMDDSINTAKENGYVETIYGRKRFLSDINSRNAIVRGYAERNAINAPIQGSAADIIKVAMIRIYNELKNRNLKTKMILQVHDELNFNVPTDELEEVKTLIVAEMENAFKLSIPLKTDIGVGDNWLIAH
ncbi:MAG: DNA polymerase I [Proteiniphilum sp.]|nr:DNA polymerase I [Proteiniphilum sp.]